MSEDPAVIGERKQVVDDCLKALDRGLGGNPGLRSVMRDKGLDAHWSPGHLTNVYWR